MEPTGQKRDRDPLWLQALEESIEHHWNGAIRTVDNYLTFPMGGENCAVCQYVRPVKNPHDCFLYDDVEANCSKEYQYARSAYDTDDFPTFHAAEVALYVRICVEYERVKSIQTLPTDKEIRPATAADFVFERGNVRAVLFQISDDHFTLIAGLGRKDFFPPYNSADSLIVDGLRSLGMRVCPVSIHKGVIEVPEGDLQ